ncbi:lysosomal amino acid transporter 1 homolog [Plakobranchus ocellatus]|uniref:Lysosomal amino acid transporter 1 homolog n=1 Tax=Plakobranchus ocellatus TaxID=259542 RepID=A0AAV4CVV2_9GAST|nr:lysosomal amino acid transporter 1 homolog [Plakobranchus ocellatus]
MPYMRFGPLGTGIIRDEGNSTNTTKCIDGVTWMWKYLGECVTTPQEQASEYLGLASMLIWMMVGIPQIVKNFRNLDGLAGVSFFLLFQWAGGDVTNLVGSILTHQLKFQIYLAIYFVFSDAVLLLQYVAYIIRDRRKHHAQRGLQTDRQTPSASRAILCLMGVLMCSQVLFPSSQPADGISRLQTKAHTHLSRALLSVSEEVQSISIQSGPSIFQAQLNASVFQARNEAASGGSVISNWATQGFEGTEMHTRSSQSPLKETSSFWHDETNLIGYSIGIISSLFYLGSRISQIVKNVKASSTDGLSFLTFLLAVLGNLAYGLQILVHSLETEFLLEKTPWLVGSLGVIGLDCTLLCQFYYYDAKKRSISELRQSLLNNEFVVESQSASINPVPVMSSTLENEHVSDRDRSGGQQVYVY